MKQNKKPKQTLESAQYGLEINFKTNFEIEKYVNVKNNTLDNFQQKWAINGNLLLNI